AYLLRQRWPNRPEPEVPRFGPTIITLALSALLLLPPRVIVEANPIWRAGSWAMALALITLTLCLVCLAGGKSWLKHFGFPVVFFLLAVPWPSQLEDGVVQTLRRVNTAI